MSETKVCTRCDKTLPLDAFGFGGNGPSRLHPWCRKCRSEYNSPRTIYRPQAQRARYVAKQLEKGKVPKPSRLDIDDRQTRIEETK
jgi:ribosomal protein L40E